MNKFFLILCLFIYAVSETYSQHEQGPKPTTAELSVLFVGNSLTYTNNLPKLVKKYAKQEGVNLTYKMVAFPNYSLEDHWNDGEIQKLIASTSFDFIILQQGPSSQHDGRKMLIEDDKKYSNLAQLHNAKLCYFMVWPSMSNYHTFDDVIKNHTDAAAINNAILLPVGEVWKTHFDNTKNFQYYGPDGFHPSLEGSKIVAEVIVHRLLNSLKK
ncbi:SGNH/GDSL hydrolase family protein [uncultured Gelidibacter sp.]|uniref:SGNH/GDSL hydrolase family protein n=1 Tax=uncultured Gelidibacter sp. TaxID=259318 RepID=UPI002610CA93|nr:SGNH/GDSL hydrolase family protein [uncultured Gelidibacter sp.]